MIPAKVMPGLRILAIMIVWSTTICVGALGIFWAYLHDPSRMHGFSSEEWGSDPIMAMHEYAELLHDIASVRTALRAIDAATRSDPEGDPSKLVRMTSVGGIGRPVEIDTEWSAVGGVRVWRSDDDALPTVSIPLRYGSTCRNTLGHLSLDGILAGRLEARVERRDERRTSDAGWVAIAKPMPVPWNRNPDGLDDVCGQARSTSGTRGVRIPDPDELWVRLRSIDTSSLAGGLLDAER